MNILMVGHSRAGKTSFMAGMYKFLGESKDGYGITAIKESQKIQLKRLATGLSNNKYPSGTDVQSTYDFFLTVDGEKLIPFNWMDYRGGALMSYNINDPEVKNLQDRISKADALLIFLDGQKLQHHREEYEIEYDVLISSIVNAISNKKEGVFPISFVITKCDILDQNIPLDGLDYFNSLFQQIRQSEHVEGMISYCSVNSQSCHSPFYALFYSLYRGAPIYMARRIEAINRAKERQSEHEPIGLITGALFILEHAASRVADALFDEGWNSEIDLYRQAGYDIEKEEAAFNFLSAVQNDMKEKLQEFVKNEMIYIF